MTPRNVLHVRNRLNVCRPTSLLLIDHQHTIHSIPCFTMVNRRKKLRKSSSRRAARKAYRRPTLPTIPEQPQEEELLAALELVEVYRQQKKSSPRSKSSCKRDRQNHNNNNNNNHLAAAADNGEEEEVASGQENKNQYEAAPSPPPSPSSSSSPTSVFCFKFVGKLVDLSNLVSSDFEQPCNNDDDYSGNAESSMCSSSSSSNRSFGTEMESDSSTTFCEQQPRTLALPCDIYPTLRNVEDIAELDVDKVLQDCIAMRNSNKRGDSRTNGDYSSRLAPERSVARTSTLRYLLEEQQVPPMATSPRSSRPRSSDWENTGFNRSSSSRRSDDYKDEPKIESLRFSASTTHESLFSSSLSSSSSSFQPPPLPVQVDSIEISPGCAKALRGADETTRAVESGFIEHQDCLSCSVPLVYVADAEYVLCPKCRVISPVLSCFGMSNNNNSSSSSSSNINTLHFNPCKQRPLNFCGSAAGGVGLGLLAGSLPRVG